MLQRQLRQGLPGPSRRGLRIEAFKKSGKRMKYSGIAPTKGSPTVISVQPDGSDSWRLDQACAMLREGGTGVIPTDTFPALVVDLHNRNAMLKLAAIKDLDPKKPLSILCRNFQDISQYTGGFPAANAPGQPNWFNLMRKNLPGAYTLILPSSKNLPGHCVDYMKGTTRHRRNVGVRMPNDPVCQAILEGMEGPLLSTSVHVTDIIAPGAEIPDVGSLLDAYAGTGVDFIVDVGPRMVYQSTVVDMSGSEPEILRVGQGDPSIFE